MLSFLTDLPVRDACCDHLRRSVGKVCVKGARLVGPVTGSRCGLRIWESIASETLDDRNSRGSIRQVVLSVEGLDLLSLSRDNVCIVSCLLERHKTQPRKSIRCKVIMSLGQYEVADAPRNWGAQGDKPKYTHLRR